MGCVGGRPGFETPGGERLLVPAGLTESNLSCLTPRQEEVVVFSYKINFGSRPLDAEAQVIKCLAGLLWKPPDAMAPETSECIRALRSMQASGSEALCDLVVPVVNVVLHAPFKSVRETLWSSFVVDAVANDFALAHLFYWALHCVAKAPEAEAKTRSVAAQRLEEVSKVMASQAQLSAALAAIDAANGALKKGSVDLQQARHATSVTPLVDLLERLHVIGNDIVEVKDKEARLLYLRDRLRQDINESPFHNTQVPVLMLAPQAFPRRGPNSQGAGLLRIPPDECRVLSSKERAPYLVVLEVDRAATGRPRGQQTRRGLCPCRARRPAFEDSQPLISGKGPNGASPPSSSSADRRTSIGVNSNVSGRIECLHHELVSQYLEEQDRRPRGAFQEATWEQVVSRVRRSSLDGMRPKWGLLSMIVKSNADDVRQEELAYRLLKWFQRVFKRHKLKHWIHPFLIIATHHDGGCLETVTNAVSLSDLKKSFGDRWVSLRSYFEQAFPRVAGLRNGANGTRPGPPSLDEATMNFIWSMAAYSIVCYVLAIRDRHNGNILIDDEGHILHVDFGFMLCGAPGGKALQKMGGFEHSKGFKLTQELAEVLGPMDGSPFKVFRQAVREGMLAVRQHAEELLALLQLSMLGTENKLQRCFTHPSGYPEAVLEDICERLGLQNDGTGSMSNADFGDLIDRQTDESVDHWRSRLYDKYQYHFTGVH